MGRKKTDLAGRIGRGAGIAPEPGDAGRGHDAGAGDHAPQLRPHAVEDAPEVDVEDGVPVLVGRLDDGPAHGAQDPGQVGGAGQGPQARDGRVEPGGHLRRVAHVDGGGVDAGAWDRGCRLQRGDGGVEGVRADVGEGDGGAAGGDEVGGCEGDAGGGACDGYHFAF